MMIKISDSIVFIGMAAASFPASALAAEPDFMRPAIYSLDENSVDVANLGFHFSDTVVGDGGESLLNVVLRTGRGGWVDPIYDNYNVAVVSSTSLTLAVNDGEETYTFPSQAQASLIPDIYGRGANFVKATSTTPAKLITPTGKQVEYGAQIWNFDHVENFATRISWPNGYVATIVREYASGTGSIPVGSRILQVYDNKGFGLDYDYRSDLPWTVPVKITRFNRTARNCPASADPCAAIVGRPAVEYTYVYKAGSLGPIIDSFDVKTSSGKLWRFHWFSARRITAIDNLNSPGLNTVINYVAVVTPNIFTGLVNYRGSWVYEKSTLSNGHNRVTVKRNGALYQTFETANSGRVYQWTNPNGGVTSYVYDSVLRPLEIHYPEGNYSSFAYDGRGNVVSRTETAKSGSGLSQRVASATYPADCVNSLTCNQPTSEKDFNGNVTSFTYSSDHGGVLTETSPSVGGVQPVKRYTYVQRYAWVSNGSGGYAKEATPVWLISQVKTCRSSATVVNSCSAGTGDETITTYDYGPDQGPNNLFVRGVVVEANGRAERRCFAYDENGRKISETSPRAEMTTCP